MTKLEYWEGIRKEYRYLGKIKKLYPKWMPSSKCCATKNVKTQFYRFWD